MSDDMTLTAAIASQNPDTPCYIFDASRVVRNYTTLRNTLGTSLIVSIKANSNQDLIYRLSHIEDISFEVASYAELKKVLGFKGRIFVNNPSMSEEFITAAIAVKAQFIVDSIEQLSKIVSMLKGKKRDIFLRLNSSILTGFGYESGRNIQDHFGLDMESAELCIDLLKKNDLGVSGIHIFTGPYSFQTAKERIRPIKECISHIESRLGQIIPAVNLGGGFSENWDGYGEYFNKYKMAIKEYFSQEVEILHESGRGIFGDAGCFVAGVRNKKSIGGQKYIVTDGGIGPSFLLTMNESVIKKYKNPTVLSKSKEVTKGRTLLVGGSCNRTDIIGQLMDGDIEPQEGDYLVFDNAGAYYSSYTMKEFLSLSPPKIYVIN